MMRLINLEREIKWKFSQPFTYFTFYVGCVTFDHKKLLRLLNAFSYFIVLFFGTQLIFNFNWFFWWFFNLWWIISWLWKSHLSLIFVELQSMMGGGGKFLPCFFPWMTDIDATLNMTRRKHTRAVVRSRV